MKGRTKTNPTPEVKEQETTSENVQVVVNENNGSNDGDGKDKNGPPEVKERDKENDCGGIPKETILNAIKHNPHYSQFYLNSKGFVFVLGTPKKQMGDGVVLIKANDFK